MEYTKEQIEEWKKKAEKLDGFTSKLDDLLAKGYDEELDTFNEEEETDLIEIGELVMSYFGHWG